MRLVAPVFTSLSIPTISGRRSFQCPNVMLTACALSVEVGAHGSHRYAASSTSKSRKRLGFVLLSALTCWANGNSRSGLMFRIMAVSTTRFGGKALRATHLYTVFGARPSLRARSALLGMNSSRVVGVFMVLLSLACRPRSEEHTSELQSP